MTRAAPTRFRPRHRRATSLSQLVTFVVVSASITPMETKQPTTSTTGKGASALFRKIVKTKILGKKENLFASILELKQKQLKLQADAAAAAEVEITKVESDDEADEPVHSTDLPDIDVLRTFSPLIVHQKVHSKTPGTKLYPACEVIYGAVLFADISGFTRLANLLSVEQLQLHISKYFKMLFDCVEHFGGDILKICGDAIMIMWPLKHDMASSTLDERKACALIASLCGRELIQSCGTYTSVHGKHHISLSLHCGVGVADVPCYWVGKGGRWEFLISGDCLTQISSTEPEANSGEIVISPQTYELVKEHLVASITPSGNYLLTNEILGSTTPSTNNLRHTFSSNSRYIPGLSDHPTLHFDNNRQIATQHVGKYAQSNMESLSLLNQNRDEVAIGLQHYVHCSARPRLRHLGKDFQMAELREVVTLFINITGLEEDFRLMRLDVVQNVMAAIIDSHKSFGGTLRQFVVDDKGCVAIGSLGVPHHTFENNAVRGVEIANVLRMKLQQMGKNCSIGISSGDAFCGLVGSKNRREYAMMGSCINLAARLVRESCLYTNS